MILTESSPIAVSVQHMSQNSVHSKSYLNSQHNFHNLPHRPKMKAFATDTVTSSEYCIKRIGVISTMLCYSCLE